MNSSRVFLSRAGIFFLAAILCLPACAGVKRGAGPSSSVNPERKISIAVLPLENLSGTAAPLKAIRESLIRQLGEKGFYVLDEDTLEKFMVRNRIRYTGGMDEETARTMKRETGVDGILITALEQYSDTPPPKVAFTARLVRAGDIPFIEWIDGVGLAGDDAPGILSLGLIDDPQLLIKKAMEKISISLRNHYFSETETSEEGVPKKFRPKTSFRAPFLEAGKKYRVAVVPFFNRSERKYAGEVMVLQFIRDLKISGKFDVIEPGLVRKAFLTSRMIMQDGISLVNANTLFSQLDADLILAGQVLDYQDYQGVYGKPKVNFSVQAIERESQRIVWSSMSYNEGDDDVYFFDWGRINTAHAMASRMVRLIGNMMTER
jgi:TolB-like protein